MSVTITTRTSKGSQLTWEEVDANFTNLNTGKADQADLATLDAAVGDTTIDLVSTFESALV